MRARGGVAVLALSCLLGARAQVVELGTYCDGVEAGVTNCRDSCANWDLCSNITNMQHEECAAYIHIAGTTGGRPWGRGDGHVGSYYGEWGGVGV